MVHLGKGTLSFIATCVNGQTKSHYENVYRRQVLWKSSCMVRGCSEPGPEVIISNNWENQGYLQTFLGNLQGNFSRWINSPGTEVCEHLPGSR